MHMNMHNKSPHLMRKELARSLASRVEMPGAHTHDVSRRFAGIGERVFGSGTFSLYHCGRCRCYLSCWAVRRRIAEQSFPLASIPAALPAKPEGVDNTHSGRSRRSAAAPRHAASRGRAVRLPLRLERPGGLPLSQPIFHRRSQFPQQQRKRPSPQPMIAQQLPLQLGFTLSRHDLRDLRPPSSAAGTAGVFCFHRSPHFTAAAGSRSTRGSSHRRSRGSPSYCSLICCSLA